MNPSINGSDQLMKVTWAPDVNRTTHVFFLLPTVLGNMRKWLTSIWLFVANTVDSIFLILYCRRRRRQKERDLDLHKTHPHVHPCLVPKSGTSKPRQSRKRRKSQSSNSMTLGQGLFDASSHILGVFSTLRLISPFYIMSIVVLVADHFQFTTIKTVA